MLVTVFELQQIGLPADRAIKTVEAGWDELRVGYGVAFELQDQFDPLAEKIFGWIHARSLRELQVDNRPFAGAKMLAASAIREREIKRIMASLDQNKSSYSYVLLDLSSVMNSVVYACRNVAGVNDIDLGAELNEWSKHKGGSIRGGHPLHTREDEPDVHF